MVNTRRKQINKKGKTKRRDKKVEKGKKKKEETI
jgi:hypothetical protein